MPTDLISVCAYLPARAAHGQAIVNPRLHEDFHNGDQFHARAGRVDRENQEGLTMAYIKARGCHFYYAEKGEGPLILLIPPAGSTASTWGTLVGDRVCCIERSQVISTGRFAVNTEVGAPWATAQALISRR